MNNGRQCELRIGQIIVVRSLVDVQARLGSSRTQNGVGWTLICDHESSLYSRLEPHPLPLYRKIAHDLVKSSVVSVGALEIARKYRVPLLAARFAERAARTELRVREAERKRSPERRGRFSSWREIADDLRERIKGGNMSRRLPSRSRLAQEYGVSPRTMTRATTLLTEEGVIVAVGTQGTYIAEPLWKKSVRSKKRS
ncbi:GntR family transcriptional regulator [Streptomyces sp. ISL-44]|uniref:GntR family transcriptional regulator n=1 Tax=Streptomyces sp. ISL-44 TaxID=2819184 RepID=UPI001BE94BCA|nr:GntR family transcriptional regulator [Streptomyces sp. ISL-44]